MCRETASTLTWPGRDRVQVIGNTSSGYHVQHAVRYVARWGSSAFKFDRAEIAFTVALLHWVKPQVDKGGEGGGEERGTRRKPLTTRFRKSARQFLWVLVRGFVR